MAEHIGRYEIKRELGRGGMATVYLARDPRFERRVAIKVLPRQFTHDPRFLARFEQEARTIAALEDPAIVPVYDFGEQDDAPYIVMRYMTGGTLRERMGGRPMPLVEIERILERLAPALDKAHQRGIIHRDLKPDNVLFDEEQRPYLADFGIARMAEATQTMTIVGTPSYMSPEQVQGKQKLDWRSDLYALGVMLFEMLTGKQPYEAETPSGQMFMHVMEPVPEVLALNPDLPPQAQNVIDKAMAKGREERYQSAGEMATAVSGIVTSGQWRAAGAAVVEDEKQTVLLEPQEEDVAAAPMVEEVEPAEVPDSQVGRGLPALKTVLDTPPEAQSDPVPAVEKSARSATNTADYKRREQDSGSSKLPAWAWWGGAVVVLLMLVFGIRSIFNGGDLTPGAEVGDGASAAAILPTETATPTSEPPTATNVPTKTQAHTATNTPTATLIPSPTVDPNRPPPDSELGSEWSRPQDKMNMLYVPAGSFTMGSEDGDSDEEPLHRVGLDGFWIDGTEVTNRHYADFLSDLGNLEEGGVTWYHTGNDQVTEEGGKFVAQPGFADHPVINISWYGAAAYCDWAGGQLPTEAQWEYAARGPQNLTYPWGNESPTCDLTQYSECGGQTVPVGSYVDGASWVGALDMAGNVWEWVNDWYDGSYYENSPPNNPQGPERGTDKVLRGGGRSHESFFLRGANRGSFVPAYRDDALGFRCALPGK